MINANIKKFLTMTLVCACVVTSMAGCGTEETVVRPEDVTLLEPVGVTVNYETAAIRDMYSAKVYGATVVPYVEEYELESGMSLQKYNVLPGDTVGKGDVIISGNTESIDKNIENLEKSIKEQAESYEEYKKEQAERRAEYEEIIEQYNHHLSVNQDELAKATAAKNEEDIKFYKNNIQSNESVISSYNIKIMKIDAELEQKEALYKLDYDYNKLKLKRLKEDRNNYVLISKMSGVVTSMYWANLNSWLGAGTKVVAVADMNQKILKSDFISKTDILKAEKYYAIINGKSYEVEYKVMETDEYKRIQEENDGKVYTTFYIKDMDENVEIGGYAAIVLVRKSSKNAITIPQDAITYVDSVPYVYVLKDGESVYTAIKVGIQDGLYAEVLSGIEEGDKILTDKATQNTDKTVTLTKGTVKHEFSEKGYLAYPTQQWITNPIEYGTTYFVENKVSLYQQVEKGETVAVIRVEADNISLQRMQKQLQRENERLAELVEEKAKAETDKEKESKQKSIDAKKETIADLEKEIKQMKTDFATTEIKAPYAGIITELPWGRSEGDLLQNGANIVCIADQSLNYIVVEDSKGLLTYGNTATITYDDRNGQKATAIGEVVSLGPASVSKDLFDNGSITLIKVSAEDVGDMAGSAQGYDGWWSRSRFSVSVVTREMSNVVLVPKKAVTASADATYVKIKLANGEVRYQSFIAGGYDNTYYWVAEGLTEGMEVCTE